MVTHFLDTFALVEIEEGNPKYLQYAEFDFVITALNLMEFHYYLLRTFGQASADEDATKLLKHVVNFDHAVMFEANKFRYKNKAKEVSTADCVGYIYALKSGLKFVTGDREFEGLPSVEFVKK